MALKKTLLLLLFILSLPTFAWSRIDPLLDAIDRRDLSSQPIREALQSNDLRLRVMAARGLGQFMDTATANSLLTLLHDPKIPVVNEAIFGLGQLGWLSSLTPELRSRIVINIEPFLVSTKFKTRQKAIEAIGKLAFDKADLILSEHLDDKNLKIRQEVLRALFLSRYSMRLINPNIVLPPFSHELLEKMCSSVSAGNKSIVQEFIYIFSRLNHPEAVAQVTPFLDYPDELIRLFAINAIARNGSTKDSGLLIKATWDQSSKVRLAAIEGLIRMNSADLVPENLAKDPNDFVRSLVARSLALTTNSKPQIIETLWADPIVGVRAEALTSYLNIHPEVIENLESLLTDASWIIRISVAVQSSRLKAESRSRFLEKAFKDPDINVRIQALYEMGSLSDSQTLNLIKLALESHFVAERGQALESLKTRTDNGRELLAWQSYQKSPGPKWTEFRESIADMMATIPGETTTEYLKAMLKDESKSVALIARLELIRRGLNNIPFPNPSVLSFSPYRDLSFQKNPVVQIRTSKGYVTIELYPDKAPIHVANFIGLAEAGFYNGLMWHRVVSNFVIQGGDPEGTGWGGADYNLRAEFNDLHFDSGTIGMPRSQGFDTGGTQIFITHIPTPHLDGLYTAFGRVTKGMDVIDKITVGDLIEDVRVFLK